MTATAPAPAGLDELDALLTAATPGEWRMDNERDVPTYFNDGTVACADVAADGSQSSVVASGWCQEYGDQPACGAADAALIVALRNRAPAMLAAIRAAYALAETIADEALDSLRCRAALADSASRLRTTLDEALGVEK